MKKFVAVIVLITFGVYVGNVLYPKQAHLLESSLMSAGTNMVGAVASDVTEHKVNNNQTQNGSPNNHQATKKPTSQNNASQSSRQNVKIIDTSKSRVAPPNSICLIYGSDAKIKSWVTPDQWNKFVEQHPDYWVDDGIDDINHRWVCQAYPPSVTPQKVQGVMSSIPTQYVIVDTIKGDNGSVGGVGVSESYFESMVKLHKADGWKVFTAGNTYLLIAPGYQLTVDGVKFSNP